MNACRSCKAPIVWAISTTGAPMPVDPDPHPRGNLHLDERPTSLGAMPLAIVLPGPARAEHAGQLYLSHFASCPYAAENRRR